MCWNNFEMYRIIFFGNGINEICDIFIKKNMCGIIVCVKFNVIIDLEFFFWVVGGDGYDVID